MEIYERIRILRKDYLKMSMEEFGKKLAVSRDMISNIELNRLARPEQKTSLYKLICSTFNISEDWLMRGIEPIEAISSQYSLDELVKSKNATDFELVKSKNATDFELEIIKIYFELNEKIREQVAEHFKQSLAAALSSSDDETEDDNILQAAHRRTDIEVTQDMDDFDNAIMDDKNF